MRSVKRPLNWFLVIIALVSVAAAFLGQENPFMRVAVCTHVRCPTLANSHAWEKIAHDLGIGGIISLFFYWLVVRLPENAKRRRIRNSFVEHFREFKEDTIATTLMVTDGSGCRLAPAARKPPSSFAARFLEVRPVLGSATTSAVVNLARMAITSSAEMSRSVTTSPFLVITKLYVIR
jgi:hypothetical protein